MNNCKNAFDYPTNEKERNVKEIIEKSFRFKPGDKVYWVDERIWHGLNDCICKHGIAVATLEDGTKHEVDCPLCEVKRKSITLYEPTVRSGIVTEIEFEGGYCDCEWYSSDTSEGAGIWYLSGKYVVACDDDTTQTAYLTMEMVSTLGEAENLCEEKMVPYNEHLKAIRFCVDSCSSFDSCDIKDSDNCPCVDCEHFDSCSHSEGSC